MIKGKNYEITTKNLSGHEWIGLEVKVVESSDPQRKEMRGKIIDETQNTLILETIKGKKVVPKKECSFEFDLNGEKEIIKGNEFIKRPEDRVKDFRN